MRASAKDAAVLLLVAAASAFGGADAFVIGPPASCCERSSVMHLEATTAAGVLVQQQEEQQRQHSRPQKSLVFPIKPPLVPTSTSTSSSASIASGDSSSNNSSGGRAKTEIDIGNSLSSAFGDLVDSSDFMISSPSEPPMQPPARGHRSSSCRMPVFGDSAVVTFAPRRSTLDGNGNPTEYVLSARNFEQPDGDFANLCMEIYKYRDDMKGVVSMEDLRHNVVEYLNSLPPDPGFDADLTSSEAIGDPQLGRLINRLVDAEALRNLSRDGFVVIDNVMTTSQSSHDKLNKWSRKRRPDQAHCRTDVVSFLNKEDATECGVEDQYDLLLALASHLNDKLDLYDSPYEPVFPGTEDRPLTNPTLSTVQMAEYGCGDFYLSHSDNSFDAKHRDKTNLLLPKRRSNYRCVTAILYTNEGWEVSDGGQLRMYPDSQFVEHIDSAKETHQYVDINPSNGKLLLFDSRIVHSVEEVTHQSKIRRALTLWITRPEESGVTGKKKFLMADEDENDHFIFA